MPRAEPFNPWSHEPPARPREAHKPAAGFDITKGAVPVLLFIGALVLTASAAFGAGSLWTSHQSRLERIEAQIGELTIKVDKLVNRWEPVELRKAN